MLTSLTTDDNSLDFSTSWALFAANDSVIELRCLNVGLRQETWAGWFDNPDAFQQALQKMESLQPSPSGIYATLNPVDAKLLARRANQIKAVKGMSLTGDGDILRRRWLPVDCDPVRPSEISSTNAEHQAALERADQIRNWLGDHGWPDPVYADSGNGAHLLYPVDLPNDDASRNLVQQTLEALAVRFSDSAIDIDTTVANAARIWKVYGTMARKGESTSNRPYRHARVLSAGPRGDLVTVEQLAGLADQAPTSDGTAESHSGHLVDQVLTALGISSHPEPWQQGSTRWRLDRCPFSEDHVDGAFVVQLPNGSLAAGCHHSRCQSKTWHDLRALAGLAPQSVPALEAHPGSRPGDGDLSDWDPPEGPSFPLNALPDPFGTYLSDVGSMLGVP